MSEDRKQIIVEEIRYWKASRLLPEKYCDFLLALYTKGEDEGVHKEMAVVKGKRIHVASILFAITLILLPLSFLVIYFTELDMILQTGLLSSFVLWAIIHFWKLKRKGNEQFHFPLITGLLIALLLTVHIANELHSDNWSVYAAVTVHCLIWAWVGKHFRITYLLISSIVGIIVMLGFIVL